MYVSGQPDWSKPVPFTELMDYQARHITETNEYWAQEFRKDVGAGAALGGLLGLLFDQWSRRRRARKAEQAAAREWERSQQWDGQRP